ncbi:transposase [Streptomyces mirabilis]|uniref:transposase n=1 Tax=Streptomyces TaxID=1883 RepID=UPI0013DC571B|nr:transposase [Streptomyces mirabilis]
MDAIAEGGTRILSVTVRFERGRWFAVLQTEERHTIAPAGRPGTAVGIDLGVKTLLVMADSADQVREVANPKHYDQALTQLRKASRTVSRRRGPNRRTGQAPSRRWEKANAVRNRVHHRVANLRENHLHQATARIPAEYGTVVVEDLNLNPPPAEAGGFLAQAACGSSGPTGLTPSTPAGSEPARFGTTSKGVAVLAWLSLSTVCALGSRNAHRPRYPIAWTVFRPGGETPFPALLRRSPIPSRPEGRGILGGTR